MQSYRAAALVGALLTVFASGCGREPEPEPLTQKEFQEKMEQLSKEAQAETNRIRALKKGNR